MARHPHGKRRGRRRGDASQPHAPADDYIAPDGVRAEPAPRGLASPPPSPAASPTRGRRDRVGKPKPPRPACTALPHDRSPCAACAGRPRNARLRAELLAALAAARAALDGWADDVGIGDGDTLDEMEWQPEAERVVVFAAPAAAVRRRQDRRRLLPPWYEQLDGQEVGHRPAQAYAPPAGAGDGSPAWRHPLDLFAISQAAGAFEGFAAARQQVPMQQSAYSWAGMNLPSIAPHGSGIAVPRTPPRPAGGSYALPPGLMTPSPQKGDAQVARGAFDMGIRRILGGAMETG